MQIKFLKIKKSFKKGGLHIDPEIYWVLCLFTALLIISVSIIFGFNLFTKVNKELSSIADTSPNAIKTVDTEKIKKTLDYFSSREEESFNILNSSAPVVDPSR
jgi:hypothetical protein